MNYNLYCIKRLMNLIHKGKIPSWIFIRIGSQVSWIWASFWQSPKNLHPSRPRGHRRSSLRWGEPQLAKPWNLLLPIDFAVTHKIPHRRHAMDGYPSKTGGNSSADVLRSAGIRVDSSDVIWCHQLCPMMYAHGLEYFPENWRPRKVGMRSWAQAEYVATGGIGWSGWKSVAVTRKSCKKLQILGNVKF